MKREILWASVLLAIIAVLARFWVIDDKAPIRFKMSEGPGRSRSFLGFDFEFCESEGGCANYRAEFSWVKMGQTKMVRREGRTGPKECAEFRAGLEKHDVWNIATMERVTDTTVVDFHVAKGWQRRHFSVAVLGCGSYDQYPWLEWLARPEVLTGRIHDQCLTEAQRQGYTE